MVSVMIIVVCRVHLWLRGALFEPDDTVLGLAKVLELLLSEDEFAVLPHVTGLIAGEHLAVNVPANLFIHDFMKHYRYCLSCQLS